MNQFMKTQINQMLSSVQIFQQSLQLAAIKDDGVISKEEAKELEKIKKASLQFEKELKKIMKWQKATEHSRFSFTLSC